MGGELGCFESKLGVIRPGRSRVAVVNPLVEVASGCDSKLGIVQPISVILKLQGVREAIFPMTI